MIGKSIQLFGSISGTKERQTWVGCILQDGIALLPLGLSEELSILIPCFSICKYYNCTRNLKFLGFFRQEVRERQTNIIVRNINLLPPVGIPAGHGTPNLGMCPDQQSNPRLSGAHGNAPTATRPGLSGYCFEDEVKTLQIAKIGHVYTQLLAQSGAY